MAKLGPVTEGPMTKEQTEKQEQMRKSFDELRELEDQLGWDD